MKFIKKRKKLMKSKFIKFFKEVRLMLYIINDIIELWDLIINFLVFSSMQEVLIIFSIILICILYIYFIIYKNNQSKIDIEKIEHNNKVIEKNYIEETKYKIILDNNLTGIIDKFIEKKEYDTAKEVFISERKKMREHELKMQKIKNEHELNMENIKKHNFIFEKSNNSNNSSNAV